MNLSELIFGRLSLQAIPYHEPILVGTFLAVALGGIATKKIMITPCAVKIWS